MPSAVTGQFYAPPVAAYDLGGMREGDVVTEFNGYKARTPEELNRRIRLTKPRSKVLISEVMDWPGNK